MEKNKACPPTTNMRFASFLFVKLNPAFKNLLSNEKIALKQELENLVASRQDEMFLRTYSLSGLRAEYDALFWLMACDVDTVQKVWGRISTTGAGKYLQLEKSFVGIYNLEHASKKDQEDSCVPRHLFGKYKYMLLHPLVRSHTWNEISEAERQKFLSERLDVLAKRSSVIEHFFCSCGLDDQEQIVVRESNSMEDLAMASKELREQRIKMFTQVDTPYLFCVGRDLRDILDSIG